jgi:hypothetical protein
MKFSRLELVVIIAIAILLTVFFLMVGRHDFVYNQRETTYLIGLAVGVLLIWGMYAHAVYHWKLRRIEKRLMYSLCAAAPLLEYECDPPGFLEELRHILTDKNAVYFLKREEKRIAYSSVKLRADIYQAKGKWHNGEREAAYDILLPLTQKPFANWNYAEAILVHSQMAIILCDKDYEAALKHTQTAEGFVEKHLGSTGKKLGITAKDCLGDVYIALYLADKRYSEALLLCKREWDTITMRSDACEDDEIEYKNSLTLPKVVLKFNMAVAYEGLNQKENRMQCINYAATHGNKTHIARQAKLERAQNEN